MATKADLESELEQLKKELGEARTAAAEAAEAAMKEASGDDDRSVLKKALSQIDGGEIEQLFKQALAEFEEMQSKKPMMTTFAAFLLGYVIGRAR